MIVRSRLRNLPGSIPRSLRAAGKFIAQPITLAFRRKEKKLKIEYCILYSKFNTVLKGFCQELISPN
jgi:hypothetical protein